MVEASPYDIVSHASFAFPLHIHTGTLRGFPKSNSFSRLEGRLRSKNSRLLCKKSRRARAAFQELMR